MASYSDSVDAHEAVEAAKRRGELQQPERCTLCGRKQPKLCCHHWAGYEIENQLNVWWVCMLANSNLPHDGDSLDFIREQYGVKLITTPHFFEEEGCGFRYEYFAEQKKVCKWFFRWYCRAASDWKNRNGKEYSYRTLKTKFIRYLVNKKGYDPDRLHFLIDCLTVEEMLSIGEVSI